EIDFALLFWVTSNPHIFAKTLFSFQGTTCDARKRRCFILPDLCSLVKNFFLTPLLPFLQQRLLSY
ncbi:hypothetical protein, partial [Lactobacillus sp.]|uniref:hypothetical protein n=1 Tax=Lactobacillus sp. TaxID=1591 RepID=UPI0025E4AC1E